MSDKLQFVDALTVLNLERQSENLGSGTAKRSRPPAQGCRRGYPGVRIPIRLNPYGVEAPFHVYTVRVLSCDFVDRVFAKGQAIH